MCTDENSLEQGSKKACTDADDEERQQRQQVLTRANTASFPPQNHGDYCGQWGNRGLAKQTQDKKSERADVGEAISALAEIEIRESRAEKKETRECAVEF